MTGAEVIAPSWAEWEKTDGYRNVLAGFTRYMSEEDAITLMQGMYLIGYSAASTEIFHNLTKNSTINQS